MSFSPSYTHAFFFVLYYSIFKLIIFLLENEWEKRKRVNSKTFYFCFNDHILIQNERKNLVHIKMSVQIEKKKMTEIFQQFYV